MILINLANHLNVYENKDHFLPFSNGRHTSRSSDDDILYSIYRSTPFDPCCAKFRHGKFFLSHTRQPGMHPRGSLQMCPTKSKQIMASVAAGIVPLIFILNIPQHCESPPTPLFTSPTLVPWNFLFPSSKCVVFTLPSPMRSVIMHPVCRSRCFEKHAPTIIATIEFKLPNINNPLPVHHLWGLRFCQHSQHRPATPLLDSLRITIRSTQMTLLGSRISTWICRKCQPSKPRSSTKPYHTSIEIGLRKTQPA